MRTCTRPYGWVALLLLAVLVLAGPVLAKNPVKPPPPPPPPEPEADPAIAYIQTVREGKTRITKLMVMNADGSNQAEVCPIATNPSVRPDWSPDGTRLVYAGWGDDDTPGIFVVSLDAPDPIRIASLSVTPTFGPVWSPATEGETMDAIVFSDRTAGSGAARDLFMVYADGTGRVQLTDTESLGETQPTWSPSGTRVACKVDDYDDLEADDLWGLYDFSQEPGAEYTVQFHADDLYGASVLFPVWSKTREDRVAWAVWDGTSYDLWIVDVDGDEAGFPLRVTATTTTSERLVSWSPDDTRFVLMSEGVGRKNAGVCIDVMDADGTNRSLLLEDATRPVWRR